VGVVLFNDSSRSASFTLSVSAPRGTVLSAGGCLRVVDRGGAPALETNALVASGARWLKPVTLGVLQPATYWFDLAGRIDESDVTRVTQIPASALLSEVKPGAPVGLDILLPPGLRARARSVRLRIVQEGMPDGARGMVNGHPLAWARPATYVNEQPIPLDWLADVNRLVFECPSGQRDGYRLCTASLLVTE
jgi:hypothetical protein